jgi:hypothetical protein
MLFLRDWLSVRRRGNRDDEVLDRGVDDGYEHGVLRLFSLPAHLTTFAPCYNNTPRSITST